jgi:hypothetical protein
MRCQTQKLLITQSLSLSLDRFLLI